MLRVPTRFSDELEALIHETIGCCIRVHRGLGPGLLEGIYSRALQLELTLSDIEFEHEKLIPIRYRGELLCHQRLDLVLAEQIILEVKSVERLNALHQAQLLSCLRASKLEIGLLVNFNVPVLQEGLKRIAL